MSGACPACTFLDKENWVRCSICEGLNPAISRECVAVVKQRINKPAVKVWLERQVEDKEMIAIPPLSPIPASLFERKMPFSALARMLTNKELSLVWMCNQRLSLALSSVFVPRVRWPISALSLLRPSTRSCIKHIFYDRPRDNYEQRKFSTISFNKITFCPTFNQALTASFFTPFSSSSSSSCPVSASSSTSCIPSSRYGSLSPPSFSSSLVSIVFGLCFNQLIPPHIFPSSLKKIVFGEYFNQVLCEDTFPSGVEEIIFGDAYKQPLHADWFPISIKKLSFGYSYNLPLLFLSSLSCLTFLSLGERFNQDLSLSLPSSLETLLLGDNFNQTLKENILPPSIKKLSVGLSFRSSLFLPFGLESMCFGVGNRFSIPQNFFPSSLTYLQFSTNFNQPLAGLLPPNLVCVLFGTLFNQSLHAGDFFPISSTNHNGSYDEGHHNDSSSNSSSGSGGNGSSDYSSLKIIEFGDRFNQAILPGILPDSLTRLVFGADFNSPLLALSIPSSVTELKFSPFYNQSLLLQGNPFVSDNNSATESRKRPKHRGVHY